MVRVDKAASGPETQGKAGASGEGENVDTMRQKTRQTKQREHGGAGVEYALVLMVAAMVLVGVMVGVESSVSDLWNNATSQISAALGSS